MMSRSKSLSFMLLFTIIFMIFGSNVHSMELIDLGNSASFRGATGGSCPFVTGNFSNRKENGSKGCFSGSGEPSAVRITLVDKTGKKVEGTRSIDITYSSDYTKPGKQKFTIVDFSKGQSLKKSSGETFGLVNNSYKYKYSDKFGDYNSKDDFIYLAIPGGPRFTNKKQGINEFVNKLVNYDDYKYEYKNFMKPIDIVEFLTRYMNYFSDDDPYKGEKVTDLGKYYFIIEPVFFIWYNDGAYSGISHRVYGTSSEIAEILYDQSNKYGKYSPYARLGLGSRVKYFSCFAHNENTTEFEPITKGNSYCKGLREISKVTKAEGGLKQATKWGKQLLDDGYGLGVRVVKIKLDDVPDDPDGGGGGTDTNYSFDLDLCSSSFETDASGNTIVKEGDGIFYLEADKLISAEELKSNKLFWVQSDGDDPQISCYDEVYYDFSEILDKLRQPHKIISSIDYSSLPKGKGVIKRVCWIKKDGINNDFEPNDSKSDLGYGYFLKSENYMIHWDSDVEFRPNLVSKETEVISEEDSGGILKRFIYEIDYSVVVDVSIGTDIDGVVRKIDNNDLNVRLKQNAFGLGRKFINVFQANQERIKNGTWNYNFDDGKYSGYYNDTISEALKRYSLNYLDGDIFVDYTKDGIEFNDRKCKVYPEISDKNIDFVFRTISLENPFPARDGGSRIPGINWLNDDNNVFQYITNNRGIRYAKDSDDVSPEAIYSSGEIEPMYTVTLDTETMIKIRNYNKENSGYVMPSVKCDSEGKQCYSGFLREVLGENLDGVCVLEKSTDEEKIKSILWKEGPKIEMTVEELSFLTAGFKNRRLDLNKNNVNDSEDIEIINNYNLNTPFYTCANKTYKSGGPVSYSEGGSD